MKDETVTAPAAQAGTGTEASGVATPPGTTVTAPPEWANGLQDAGNREYIGSKGFKDFDAVVASARFADKVQSEFADFKTKALIPLAEDATAEQRAAFYDKLGRPDKPDAYDFKLPDGVPKDMPYDADFASAFKKMAHDRGLTKSQAAGLHDDFVKMQGGAWATQQEGSKAAIEARKVENVAKAAAAVPEIEKAWGAKGTAGFTENLQWQDRFLRASGNEATMAKLEAAGLVHDGMILEPALAIAFAVAGKSLMAEGGGQLVTGTNNPGGVNPFADATKNVTEQMRMYRSNPALAATYIRAAGKQPSDFGLK